MSPLEAAAHMSGGNRICRSFITSYNTKSNMLLNDSSEIGADLARAESESLSNSSQQLTILQGELELVVV